MHFRSTRQRKTCGSVLIPSSPLFSPSTLSHRPPTTTDHRRQDDETPPQKKKTTPGSPRAIRRFLMATEHRKRWVGEKMWCFAAPPPNHTAMTDRSRCRRRTDARPTLSPPRPTTVYPRTHHCVTAVVDRLLSGCRPRRTDANLLDFRGQ